MAAPAVHQRRAGGHRNGLEARPEGLHRHGIPFLDEGPEYVVARSLDHALPPAQRGLAGQDVDHDTLDEVRAGHPEPDQLGVDPVSNQRIPQVHEQELRVVVGAQTPGFPAILASLTPHLVRQPGDEPEEVQIVRTHEGGPETLLIEFPGLHRILVSPPRTAADGT